MKTAETKKQSGLFFRFVKLVEAGGNKLPHPVYIYVFLIAVVFVVSMICANAGVSVSYDAVNRATGEIVPTTVHAVNLFSKEALQKFLANIVTAYDNNAVLPAILVITMFIAVADKSGFFSAALRKLLLGAPRSVATYALAVVGVCANVMSDAGMVLAASLGAVVFKAIGRNPWLGIMVGYGAAAAGFTANLIPANTDILQGTITNSVSEPLGVTINPLCNYYFMIVATFFIAAGITLICEKLLVKLLGDKEPGSAVSDSGVNEYDLTKEENRGLKYAGIAFLVFAAIILACAIPKDGFFRNAEGGLLPRSPLISSLVPIICIAFLVLGVAYGTGSGTIKKAKDVPLMMTDGVRGLAGLVTNFFPIALFIYVFGLSNLSSIIAVAGERFLRSIGFTGLPMLCVFSITMGVMNMFMYGGASRWAIFAPIFVPMFMGLDIHPALIQLAYRIGDSWACNIMPLNACLLITLTLMSQYRDPEINPDEPGLGTILSSQIPISISTLVVMLTLMCIFTLTGIPLGPGL